MLPNVLVEPCATARVRALYSWRCGSNRLLDPTFSRSFKRVLSHDDVNLRD